MSIDNTKGSHVNSSVILAAIVQILAKPFRDGCNSEAAFVRSMLDKMGCTNEAIHYWNWICMDPRRVAPPAWATAELVAMQKQLDLLDKKTTMPAWGISGT